MLELPGGVGVAALEQRPDAPAMVYAMNLGLVLNTPERDRAMLSHMRYAERRTETLTAGPWFEEAAAAALGWRPNRGSSPRRRR